MSAIEKFASFLHQGSSVYRPSMERFPPLDIDRLEDELKVKETARERGAKELPNSAAEVSDAEELVIRGRIEEEVLKARDHVSRELKSFNVRAAAYRLEGKKFVVETIARDAIANFRSAADQGVNQLTLYLQRLQDNHKHRTQFKKENRLARPVKESSGTIVKVGFLLILGLVETFINGAYFSVGLDTGLLGGLSVALGIAVLNIGMGAVAGVVAFREVCHTKPVRMTCGWIGVATYLLLVVGFNLMVSQYRLALQGELADQAAGIAWNALFGLDLTMDFDGLVVTVVGIAFSALAACDLYYMWDAYPGYSRIEAAYRRAAEDYSNGQREVMTELGAIKDASINELKAQRDLLPMATQHVEAAIVGAKQLVDEYKSYLRSLSHVSTAMIRRYRDENSLTRTTPPPAYFNQPIEEFEDSSDLDSQLPTVDSQGQTELMREFSEKLSSASETIFSEFDAVQKRFPLLEEIVSQEEVAVK
jgi:hypothetical protein